MLGLKLNHVSKGATCVGLLIKSVNWTLVVDDIPYPSLNTTYTFIYIFLIYFIQK